jgi:hypothetical protein
VSWGILGDMTGIFSGTESNMPRFTLRLSKGRSMSHVMIKEAPSGCLMWPIGA